MSESQVRVASNRIVDVIDQLKREGFDPIVLETALIDACIRLGRFYMPNLLTGTLCRRLSKIASDMAEDEESEARARIKT